MKRRELFFCNSLAFSMVQRTSAVWSLVPLPLQRPNCTSVSSQFTYWWSLAWRILSITLLTCEHKWEHLHGSLNALCRCPSLGLKWEPTFSSPVATAAVVVVVWLLQPSGLEYQALSPQDFPGESTRMGCHFLLQGIFPTQGSSSHFPYCRQILYSWVTKEA